jgi:hypothetical protein
MKSDDKKRGTDDTCRSLVVNLYGGPGTGKSTTAAELFALLKRKDFNAELATEYAKDIVWEGRGYLLSDQIYIFAKQNRKLMRLYGKVDIVVTDSPLLLCYFYSNNPHILALIQEEVKKADHLHFFLMREKSYNPKGRYQTESQACEIDSRIKQMLDALKISYHEVAADGDAAEKIMPLLPARFL